jgi:hypothetical protein
MHRTVEVVDDADRGDAAVVVAAGLWCRTHVVGAGGANANVGMGNESKATTLKLSAAIRTVEQEETIMGLLGYCRIVGLAQLVAPDRCNGDDKDRRIESM